MVNKWNKRRLGDVCEINHSKRDNNWTHPFIEYIDISSVGVGYLIDKPSLILVKEVPSRAQRLVQDGDTIVSTVRPNRRSMLYIKSPKQNTVVSTGFAVLHPKEVDPRFLYYSVYNQEFTNYLTARADGSAYPSVSPEAISDAEINLPPFLEQRAVAEVLGALDDKIELNRQMNATLESMARAMFRRWFVEGEEVEGWEQGSILEFAHLLSGGTPKTSELDYWNGNIPWVSAKDVGNVDGIFLLDTEKTISQAGLDHSSTKMLPAKTTIITARGTVGAHCMLGKNMTMNQTNYGLKAKEGIGDYFIYFTLSNMVEQLKQQSYGTIFDTITTRTFQNSICVNPPLNLIEKFEELVTPMMSSILNNQKESRTLASLRDSLLPKLMSGEVRVV
jgi:type I restriction enzyme S subunit